MGMTIGGFLTNFGSSVRTDDKQLTHEECPGKKGQDDGGPVVQRKLFRNSSDQPFEESQERCFDGECHSPYDAKEYPHDDEGIKKCSYLIGHYDHRWIG